MIAVNTVPDPRQTSRVDTRWCDRFTALENPPLGDDVVTPTLFLVRTVAARIEEDPSIRFLTGVSDGSPTWVTYALSHEETQARLVHKAMVAAVRTSFCYLVRYFAPAEFRSLAAAASPDDAFDIGAARS